MLPPPPRSTLFPYTTLFRSLSAVEEHRLPAAAQLELVEDVEHLDLAEELEVHRACLHQVQVLNVLDRKSTRLNSSHVEISYAVFCLKKKKKRIKQLSQIKEL